MAFGRGRPASVWHELRRVVTMTDDVVLKVTDVVAKELGRQGRGKEPRDGPVRGGEGAGGVCDG